MRDYIKAGDIIQIPKEKARLYGEFGKTSMYLAQKEGWIGFRYKTFTGMHFRHPFICLYTIQVEDDVYSLFGVFVSQKQPDGSPVIPVENSPSIKLEKKVRYYHFRPKDLPEKDKSKLDLQPDYPISQDTGSQFLPLEDVKDQLKYYGHISENDFKKIKDAIKGYGTHPLDREYISRIEFRDKLTDFLIEK